MRWLLLLALLAWGPWPAAASPEAAYKKRVAALKAREVVSEAQLNQALRADPGRAVEIPGVIQGLMASGAKRTLVLRLVDNSSLVVEAEGQFPEIQTGARVRCLVKPAGPGTNARLELVDICWDSTPVGALAAAARATLKVPVKDREEAARAAAALARRQQAAAPMPTRGGDEEITIKRAIAHFNPRLSAQEIDVIARSILTYCERYEVDPYLVVAVVAAESRFNPNARSYKGAAGLGQLMPATAAAHGVDPYDPVANLEVAIRIISRNLKEYNNDWNLALAAYNAGRGAVKRYGGVPPYRETREYLWRIYEYWCWLNGIQPQPRPR